MKRLLALISLAALTAVPSGALAWGNMGHRLVGQAAAAGFPSELPAFLRTPRAVEEIGEFSREPDRTKDAGKQHDLEAQAGHFVDIDENGKVLGGPPFAPVAPTRQDYEKALTPFGLNSWQVGYLQYSIIDSWQTVAKNFAYWRVLNAAEANPKWRRHRAYFKADRQRREILIMIQIGALSHYAGDGSQPLHATPHFNGWGQFPNPKGYTQARMHAPFEGELINETVKLAPVQAAMGPVNLCDCPIEARVGRYLLAGSAQVEPFYQLEKDGGFKPGDPRGTAFAVRQLGQGAAEVRSLVVEAWRASLDQKVGWRPVAVKEVIAGTSDDPYLALHGTD